MLEVILGVDGQDIVILVDVLVPGPEPTASLLVKNLILAIAVGAVLALRFPLFVFWRLAHDCLPSLCWVVRG